MQQVRNPNNGERHMEVIHMLDTIHNGEWYLSGAILHGFLANFGMIQNQLLLVFLSQMLLQMVGRIVQALVSL